MFKVSMTRLLTAIFVFAWIGSYQLVSSKIILQGLGSKQIELDSEKFVFSMQFKNAKSYYHKGACKKFTLTIGGCELKFQTLMCQKQNDIILINPGGTLRKSLIGIVNKSSIVIAGFPSNPETFQCDPHFNDQLVPEKFVIELGLSGDVFPELTIESNDFFTTITSTISTQAPTTQAETTQTSTTELPTTIVSTTHTPKAMHDDKVKKELYSDVKIAIVAFISIFVLLSILFCVVVYMYQRCKPKKPKTLTTTASTRTTTTVDLTREDKDANQSSVVYFVRQKSSTPINPKANKI